MNQYPSPNTCTLIVMAQARNALAKKSRSTAAKKQSQTYTNYIGGRWGANDSSEWVGNRKSADTRHDSGRDPQAPEKDVLDTGNSTGTTDDNLMQTTGYL